MRKKNGFFFNFSPDHEKLYWNFFEWSKKIAKNVREKGVQNIFFAFLARSRKVIPEKFIFGIYFFKNMVESLGWPQWGTNKKKNYISRRITKSYPRKWCFWILHTFRGGGQVPSLGKKSVIFFSFAFLLDHEKLYQKTVFRNFAHFPRSFSLTEPSIDQN